MEQNGISTIHQGSLKKIKENKNIKVKRRENTYHFFFGDWRKLHSVHRPSFVRFYRTFSISVCSSIAPLLHFTKTALTSQSQILRINKDTTFRLSQNQSLIPEGICAQFDRNSVCLRCTMFRVSWPKPGTHRLNAQLTGCKQSFVFVRSQNNILSCLADFRGSLA